MQASFTLKPCAYVKNLPLYHFPNLLCMTSGRQTVMFLLIYCNAFFIDKDTVQYKPTEQVSTNRFLTSTTVSRRAASCVIWQL